MRKILFVISDVDKAIAFEWLARELKWKFHLCFVLIGKGETDFSQFLKSQTLTCYEISDVKYPTSIGKWLKFVHILSKERPRIIHTHLWRANVIGLSAAWLARVKKRVYTRHHATIHYDEFPSGRKWDILNNWLATDIVAVSKNTENILLSRDKASPSKVRQIRHGFDLNYFNSVTIERVEALRGKYNIRANLNSPIIGVISRYLEWKGVQYILQAFHLILRQYPKAKLVLANASGEYKKSLQRLIDNLPAGSYVEIMFEEEVAALYRTFDLFAHTPVDAQSEAFGQVYVEALACGVPSVFTLSGVAPEFIVNEQNALVVPFCDSNSIYHAMKRILTDVELKNKLISNGKKSADLFSLNKMINGLEKLYET